MNSYTPQINKVFILTNEIDNFFQTEINYTVAMACRMLGIETILFKDKNFDLILDSFIERDCLVSGYIKHAHKVFNKLGVKQPEIDTYPEQLSPLLGRRLIKSSLKEVRDCKYDNYFIKPAEATDKKSFGGLVYDGSFTSSMSICGLPDEFPIWVSEPIEFISEYRLFIHRGKIIGAKNYKGDFTKIIDFKVAEKAIELYTEAPVGWSLDLGLISSGQTLLVEVNDAYALGSYGMSAIPYYQMIEDRWLEIVK